MSKNLNESFKILEELLRQTYDLISPMSHHEDLKELTPQFMEKDIVDRPECYIALKTGPKSTLFPVCNRIGMKAPKMIQFSLKMAQKLNNVPSIDQVALKAVIVKLSSMMTKYSKPVPRPWRAASRKGISTRAFNQNMM